MAVPTEVANYFPGYADMAVALGHGDVINSTGVLDRYHTDHYGELDSVSVEKSSMTEFVGETGIDKEVFYELDSDLHLIDPQWLVDNGFFGLDEGNVAELEENVAPFLGNTVVRRTDPCPDYRYYTLYEAFATVARVFDEPDRYEAIAGFLASTLAQIRTRSRRPSGDRTPCSVSGAPTTPKRSWRTASLTRGPTKAIPRSGHQRRTDRDLHRRVLDGQRADRARRAGDKIEHREIHNRRRYWVGPDDDMPTATGMVETVDPSRTRPSGLTAPGCASTTRPI
jgi:hypothetical protein